MLSKVASIRHVSILGFALMSALASADTDASNLTEAQALVNQFVETTGTPGLSVTVVRRNEVIWSEGFGLADVENGVGVTPNTRMRIGSISKPITAAAMAKASQQGLVDLYADVHEFVPKFPDKNHTITSLQLGGHLGGIRSYETENEAHVMEHYGSVEESLSLFQDSPLIASPGTEFHYSSYGYSLLSAVAEKISGIDFAGFLETQLWRPLGMKNTSQDDVYKILKGRARQYVKNDHGVLVNAPYGDDSYKFAGSGMLSSTSDLAKMGAALIGDQFLDAKSKRLLFTSQRTNDGSPTGYGFGWFVDMPKFLADRKDRVPEALYSYLQNLNGGRPLFWHSGTASGASAMLLLSPDTEVVVAITANLGGDTVGQQIIVAALQLEALFSAGVER